MTLKRIMTAAVMIVAVAVAAIVGLKPDAALSEDAAQGKNLVEAKAGAPQLSRSAQQAQQVFLAHSLIEYGRRTNSPEALVTAAGILGQTPTRPDNWIPQRQPTPGAGPVGEKAAEPRLPSDPATLLEQALAMSENNATVGALVELVTARPQPQLGRVEGPASHWDRVNAYTTDVYYLNFRGGEYATVQVAGDGDTDLDLFVYDENGNLIVYDDDATDYCVVGWTPKWTGVFIVKIQNLGNVYNQYHLVTN